MENSNYESRDLMMTAAFISEGIPLLGTKTRDDYIVFVLGDAKGCQEMEQRWWSGQLTVIAHRYAEVIRHLKSLIYSKRLGRRDLK